LKFSGFANPCPLKHSDFMAEDVNQIAARIIAEATGVQITPVATNGKNPAAVALGRLGGKKGGPARAAKLSKKRMKEIARKAATARWNKKKS
jgi:hypothetical protein